MKRNTSLVSYESSDEDSAETPITHAEANTASKRKLPKISPCLNIPTPADDPALHQGRIRTTPHVEGQFPAFVYISVPMRKGAPLRVLLEEAVRYAKEVEPALVCDWLDDSATYTLHVSLSRPIYLRHHQREDLKRAVKAAARTVCPFTASFSCFATFENDERTRGFLGVEVGAGHREMDLLSKAVEPTLKLLRQNQFYPEPHFHASIAWALLKIATDPIAEATPVTRVMSSFRPALVPELNAKFGQALSSNKIGWFEADRISVKIGKEIFSWALGKG